MAKFFPISPKPWQAVASIGMLIGLVACGGGSSVAGPPSASVKKAANLRLVPICEDPSAPCGTSDALTKWVAYGRLTGFSMTGSSDDGSLSITGDGALFSAFSLAAPVKVFYDTNALKWISKPSTGQGVVKVSIDEVVAGLQPVSTLQICNSDGECVPYALATYPNVCSLVTNPQTKVVDSGLLDKINRLQSRDLQVTCPTPLD